MKTEIFSSLEFESDSATARCADVINRGGLVVFPTETVYGLGADATNEDAARKIYAAKGRPSDNPLIIHVAYPEWAEKYAYTTPLYYSLAQRFMPGPLTVILKAKTTVPKATRGGLPTVAVRCPSNPIAHRLILASNTAIAAPSANLSGSPSPTSIKHVVEDMNGRVDVIIDGGDCDFGLESTIVSVDGDSLTLLRPGAITVEELRELGFEVRIADSVLEALKAGEIALSPGMKYKHYAPKCSFCLLDGDTDKIIAYIKENLTDKCGIIAYTEDVLRIKNEIPSLAVLDFGSKEDSETQAHRLFSLLRQADEEGLESLFAPLPQKSGVGLALYNRMIRAAGHKIIKL